MKKIFGFIAILLCAVLLVGCGNDGGKDLVECSSSVSEDGTTSESKMVGTFEDDKLVKMEVSSTIKMSGDFTQEDFDLGYSFFEMGAAMMDTMDGVTAKTSKTNNSMTLTATIDVKAMSDEAVEAYFEDSTVGTKAEFKAYATEEGLTCK